MEMWYIKPSKAETRSTCILNGRWNWSSFTEILQQTQEILEFAAQKLGKEDKEMAVTFVTNERSHELNLEYRDTDRPTDVISLEYKPELDIAFDEEDYLKSRIGRDDVWVWCLYWGTVHLYW